MAEKTTTATGGNINAGAAFVGGVAPVLGTDTVVIADGASLAINIDWDTTTSTITAAGTYMVTVGAAATLTTTEAGFALNALSNAGTISKLWGGTLTTNTGVVEENAGTITTNAAAGTVGTNDGTIGTNAGTVMANSLTISGGTGTVHDNGIPGTVAGDACILTGDNQGSITATAISITGTGTITGGTVGTALGSVDWSSAGNVNATGSTLAGAWNLSKDLTITDATVTITDATFYPLFVGVDLDINGGVVKLDKAPVGGDRVDRTSGYRGGMAYRARG